MYSCLIRLAPFYNVVKYTEVIDFFKDLENIIDGEPWLKSSDKDYIQKAMPLMEATFVQNETFKQDWSEYKTIDRCHNDSGFVSFTQSNKEMIEKCLAS